MEDQDLIKGENGLVYKTETILRHKNRLAEIRDRKSRQKLESIKIQKQNAKVPKSELKRPEDFVANYRTKQRNYASLQSRRRKDPNSLDVEDKALVLIIRIAGDNQLSEPQKRAFRRLQLKKQHEAALFRVDDSLKKTIRDLENRIIYGLVNRAILKALITKRGYLRVGKDIKAINSNKVVEDCMGESGIICIEDIVASLYNRSDNYPVVKKMLWWAN